MRWKKLAIGLTTATLIAVPSAILIYLAAKPHPPTPITRYLMSFKADLNQQTDQPAKMADLLNTSNPKATGPVSSAARNQAYIEQLTNEVREVLNLYKAQHPSFQKLNLHFISLNSALTPGQLNYFNMLNRTLMAISPRLGFDLQLPNPITLQEGYYEMNTDMVSFYWGPNYNGLGTWLAYMFSNGYALSNMWHPVAQLIQNYLNNNPNVNLASTDQTTSTATNQYYPDAPSPDDNVSGENWILSLAKALYEIPTTLADQNGPLDIIEKNPYYGQTTSPVPGISTKERYVVATPALILEWSQNEAGGVSNNAYTPIDTAISSWVSAHDAVGGTLINATYPNHEGPMGEGYSPWIYRSFQGGIQQAPATGTAQGNGTTYYKPSMAIQLVNYICDHIPNMPYIQNGYNTIVPSLVRFGDHAINNSYTNFRDWYYDPQENPNGQDFYWWNSNNPFAGAITPYNSGFTQTTAGPMIASTFNTLFSYSNVGDYYNQSIYGKATVDGKVVPHYVNNYGLHLDSEGTSVNPQAAIDFIKAGFNPNAINPLTQKPFGTAFGGQTTTTNPKTGTTTATGGGYINFPILPIPWVHAVNGGVKPVGNQFLSPVDFLDGFEAYQDSVNNGLNSNGYFMQLTSINYNETVNYPGNQATNTAETDKPFRIYFNKPALAGRNIIGILSNQFFSALPAFNPLVQNIVDPAKYNAIAKTADGVLNTDTTNMLDFYGCGDQYESWKTLDYASPYVITQVTPQEIVGTYNPYFFNMFSPDYNPQTGQMESTPVNTPWYNPTNSIIPPWVEQVGKNGQPTVDKTANGQILPNQNYVNFMPNPANNAEQAAANLAFPNGLQQPIRHFAKVYMNYAGGYQPQITYEMFGTGAMDMSVIPESSLDDAFDTYPDSIYEPLNNEIDQSNLVPYNTNVYSTNDAGNIMLYYQNGNPAPDYIASTGGTSSKTSHENAYSYITQDAYGNYEWPYYLTGSHQGMAPIISAPTYQNLNASQQAWYEQFLPHVKSNVSVAYNNLIVNNFYTPMITNPNGGVTTTNPVVNQNANIPVLLPSTIQPIQALIDAGKKPTATQLALLDHYLMSHSSIIIRSAINNLINWYYIFTVPFPSQSLVMQNSFMPYGVFNTYVGHTGAPNSVMQDPRWRYWSLAAYKVGQANVPLGERQGGIVQWTWTQYIQQWKQGFKIGVGSTTSNPVDTAGQTATKQPTAQMQPQPTHTASH